MNRYKVLAIAMVFRASLSTALSVTIDFESLAHSGTGTASHGALYTEDGYLLESLSYFGDYPGTFNFASWGIDDPHFSGSTALIQNGNNDRVRLTATNGQPFNLVSIDLAELYTAASAEVRFYGYFADGGSVTQSFFLDGIAFQPQTFAFSNFMSVTSVIWAQWTPYHQFDNIVIGTPDPPPASTTLVYYVATNGASQAPYDTWEKAATNIQQAVNIASNGDLIMVGPGTYRGFGGVSSGTNTVLLNKGVILRSANGPSFTAIDGNASSRGVYFQSASAVLDGFDVRNGSADKGAGLYFNGGGTATNCTIVNNTAQTDGGGVYCNGGGKVVRSHVRGNTAVGNAGGGAYLSSGGTIDGCSIVSNSSPGNAGGVYLYMGGTLRNSHLARNTTGHNGGGAYGFLGGLIQNSTISSNTASTSGGGLFCYDGGTIQNTIVYYNTAPVGSNTELQETRWSMDHCCTTPAVSGDGNMTNAPLLAGDPSATYLLRAASPCIDSGTNLNWMADATDLAGNPRIFSQRVDIGCHEATVACAGFTNANPLETTWDVLVDAKYQLQYSQNLVAPVWTSIGNVSTATQTRIMIADTNPPSIGRMYRLLWLK
jgi:hypothetical protein